MEKKDPPKESTAKINAFYSTNLKKLNKEYKKLLHSLELSHKKKYTRGYTTLFQDTVKILKSLPNTKLSLNRSEIGELIHNEIFSDIDDKDEIFENLKKSGWKRNENSGINFLKRSFFDGCF